MWKCGWLLALLGACAHLEPDWAPHAAPAVQSTSVAWRDEVVYFVVTDRFANGDRQNDTQIEPNNPVGYHGGDLAGVIAKLDYLKSLGVTALWLTPWADNDDAPLDTDKGMMWGYHGYWPKDLRGVDEHVGNLALVRQLVQQAHARGIKVLCDYVVNHVGYKHPWALNRQDPRSPHHAWFHHYGKVKDYEDPWWSEHGELHGLPDFNQDHPPVRDYLIETADWWVKQTGIDGLRIDAVKHVNRDFWPVFTQAMSHTFLVGEVLHGDPRVVAGYFDAGLPALFDFPLYYAMIDTFAKEGSATRLGDILGQDARYPGDRLMFPFLDNHDVPRFLHLAGANGRDKLKLALTFLMSVRGVPTVFYGTEAGLSGGGDPDNRPDMVWHDQDPELLGHVRSMTAMRRQIEPLRRGKQLEVWQDRDTYAFSRHSSQGEALCVFNPSASPQRRRMPLRAESQWQEGQWLTDYLSGRPVQVRQGHITVELPARSALVLVPPKPDSRVFSSSGGRR